MSLLLMNEKIVRFLKRLQQLYSITQLDAL